MTHRYQGALIVVPTYNERDCLPVLLRRLDIVCPDAQVLIVDDGSPDGPGGLTEEMTKSDRRIHVLHRTEKRG